MIQERYQQQKLANKINKCVPSTRTINGKALDNNITLSATYIGLNFGNWAFNSNSFKNESNNGNIVMGTADSGMVGYFEL